jgi:two-component system, chemotaxis family, chemotaxis protein CheY
MRFFFDYTTNDQSLYDYKGDEFQNSEDACDFAEAIAEILKNNLNGDWIGWSVVVRDTEGTKYLSLPIYTTWSHRRATTNASVGPGRSTNNSSSLLIIEDALIHSAIISRIADRVGFTVTKAHSYEDACKALSARQFDCITLDLGLGEYVGLDVLRYLSTIRCTAQIIVVSQSDKQVCDDTVDLGRTLDLNVYVSVPKPINLEALCEALVHIQVQSLPEKLVRV